MKFSKYMTLYTVSITMQLKVYQPLLFKVLYVIQTSLFLIHWQATCKIHQFSVSLPQVIPSSSQSKRKALSSSGVWLTANVRSTLETLWTASLYVICCFEQQVHNSHLQVLCCSVSMWPRKSLSSSICGAFAVVVLCICILQGTHKSVVRLFWHKLVVVVSVFDNNCLIWSSRASDRDANTSLDVNFALFDPSSFPSFVSDK